ncbi:alpha/beta hydrolase [Thalassorhabdomicrobium marinisediminis]|uniref:Alpha/beta hydrolase n=1 Tax=Thalassorhabdomicrobium marinisediminis TaxID=2170577 RepID=A0A2T7FXK9_9RHOB|nr:alpha/beta hydrolase [Thalassorhabdomicrobium marinisediminis]PVA06899.1 alpha/beta hydrolase [Thalassorhabdomicrobium marinisediminis]
MADAAPYYAAIAGNPDGACHWLLTVDGVRVRVGHWPARDPSAARGTVLIFPGRTEYVEKYGRTAADFAAQGFASVAIDWRGQGIADRLLANRAVGHVNVFADYQLDAKALLAHVKALGLPEPYHLLGHSMGGCIALRSLYEGIDVRSVMFSAPMWGIQMSAALRPIAWGLSSMSKPLGFGELFAPGQQAETYVLRTTADENTLTSDAASFDVLQQHLKQHPDLALGGPSLHWLNESLREMRALSRQPSPDLPCVTFLGTEESIVDPIRIRKRMARWPGGELVELEGARHEVLMEAEPIRARVIARTLRLFDAHSPALA